MTHLNETLYSCGIACSCEGCPTKAGNYQIDMLLANVCKQNITRFPYEIVRLAEDIAGGLMVTMPSETDFKSNTVVGRNGETIGEICNKFFAGRPDVSTEDRQRIMRFLENMCLGAAAVGYRTESLHGAGSPQAQRIMIARQGEHRRQKTAGQEYCRHQRLSQNLFQSCFLIQHAVFFKERKQVSACFLSHTIRRDADL